jgi:DNA-binding NtrC family response regulator
MRKDINDLKNRVPELNNANAPMPTEHPHVTFQQLVKTNIPDKTMEEEPVPYADEYADEYAEEEIKDPERESFSLEEVEKDMIRKALERHNGKRRNAALDLKISERTLYRKIKEYGLE